MADPNTGMEGKTRIRTGETGGSSLSQPNPLNQYASFNQIYTLSSISREDLYSLSYLKNNYKPANIIARTGGIAGLVNIQGRDRTLPADPNGEVERGTGNISSAKTAEIQDFARSVLALGQDFFFERVSIDTVPIANDMRQMTAATRIEMEIHEPLGLSLITKLRGASGLAGFDNHVEAPYLLTIEYQGFDENGQTVKLDNKYTRKIPIKIFEMRVNVNQGGAIYSIQAAPFNEFGYMDRFNKVTSDINLKSADTLKDFCQQFTKSLNEIVDTEVDQRHYSDKERDLFLITCDPLFAKEKLLKGETSIDNRMMSDVTNINAKDTTQSANSKDRYASAKSTYKKIAQVAKGTAITSVLREVMKLINPYDSYDSMLKDWGVKANGALADTVDKWNPTNGDYQLKKYKDRMEFLRKNEDVFYVSWFKITTNVKELKEFDYKTKSHKKIIHYHIEPFKIHILNFTQPGLSSNFERYRNLASQANQFLARKTYNYIFTGDNTEIMDLDLTYNVAYFSEMYKSPDPYQAQTVAQPGVGVDTGRDSNTNWHVEPDLPDVQYRVAGGKTAPSGIVGQNPAFDLWMDGFNNPTGDMVYVEMTVRGDPYYISANQFNPMDTPIIAPGSSGPGEFVNENRQVNSNKLDAHDENSDSANLNIAEPYVALNYRFPVDIDLNTGLYQLDNGFRSPFNGVYRIVGVDNRFDRGQFTQVLKMTRFRNQGVKVDRPGSNEYTQGFKGNQPQKAKDFKKEFQSYFDLAETVGEAIDNFLKDTVNKIKSITNKIIGN